MAKGKIVKTKSGAVGRTYAAQDIVNGKVPVYLATKFAEPDALPGFKYPSAYNTKAILCDPTTLKTIGFID
jgi:hypothetical protein